MNAHKTSFSAHLRRALPWVVTGLVLVYFLVSSDLDVAWRVIRDIDAAAFIGLIIGAVLITWVTDSYGMAVLFGRLNTPVSFTKDILPMRAVSYFLNSLSYGAAGGGMAFFLRNRKGTPFLEALSSFLFLNFIDVLVMVGVIVLGLVFGVDLTPETQLALWTVAAVIALIWVGTLIYWNLGFDFFLLGRLRSWAIFSAFSRAKLIDYAILAGLRLLLMLQYVVFEHLVLEIFDIHVGFSNMLVYVPLLTFLNIIPVSIASLGVPQEAMVRLYSPFVIGAQPASTIFAYSTVKIVSFVLCRALLGYFFLAGVSSDFQSKEKEGAAKS